MEENWEERVTQKLLRLDGQLQAVTAALTVVLALSPNAKEQLKQRREQILAFFQTQFHPQAQQALQEFLDVLSHSAQDQPAMRHDEAKDAVADLLERLRRNRGDSKGPEA